MTTPWHEAQVTAVYQSHRDQLLRYVRRQATDRSIPDSVLDGEGVVQEAYLAALRHWPTIRNPGAWLYAVVDNLINRASAEAPRHTALDLDHLSNAANPGGWTSLPSRLSVEDAVQVRVMLDSLGQLPGSQGVVTYLSRVQGWSHREIADHLGIEPGGSRVHLLRGTRRLREHWTSIHWDASATWTREPGRRGTWAVTVAGAWAAQAAILYWSGVSVLGAVLIPAAVVLTTAVAVMTLTWRASRHSVPAGPHAGATPRRPSWAGGRRARGGRNNSPGAGRSRPR